MLDKLRKEDFNKHLHQKFRVHADGVSLETELIECVSLGSGEEKEGRREPFSILFRGPMEPILWQRIYKVEHEQMGTLDLFLVPIGPDKTGMRYESVFT